MASTALSNVKEQLAKNLPRTQSLTNSTKITQTEDLFTLRPRYYENLRRGSRGTRAGIRLISMNSMDKRKSTVSARSSQILEKLTGGNSYADFLITDIQYGFNEKLQLTQVFGDHTVAYAFGASPVVLNISGVITDDIDNDWFVGFMMAYKDFLRGTQLARNFELAELTTNNAIFLGAITGINISQNAGNDVMVQFSMSFLVRSFEYYSASQVDVANLPGAEDTFDKMDGTFSYKTLREKAAEAKLAGTSAGDTLKQINSVISAKTASASGSCGSKQISNASVGATTFSNTSLANSLAVIDTETGRVLGTQDYAANLSKLTGGGGITGLFNELTRIKNMNVQGNVKTTLIEKKLNSFLCDKDDGIILTAMGKYSSFVETASKKYDKISGFITEVQRNVEYFNKLTSYLRDPFADVRSLVGKVRQDVQRVTDLAGMVKKSYQDLKNIKNVFSNLENDFKLLEKDFRNAKGAIAAIPDSSSEKLSKALRSGDAKLPAILGNARLGITKEQAAAKLKASNVVSLSQKLSISNPSSRYDNNADKKAVLKF